MESHYRFLFAMNTKTNKSANDTRRENTNKQTNWI